ncbi:MAG: hypothetical protein Q9227_006109 [Pyrenula ochraceoflavens]
MSRTHYTKCPTYDEGLKLQADYAEQKALAGEALGKHDNSFAVEKLFWAISLILFLWTIILAVVSQQYARGFQGIGSSFQPDFNPMRHLIEYKEIRFNQGVWNESTIYMGTPNNKTEEAWENLIRRMNFTKMPHLRWRKIDVY